MDEPIVAHVDSAVVDVSQPLEKDQVPGLEVGSGHGLSQLVHGAGIVRQLHAVNVRENAADESGAVDAGTALPAEPIRHSEPGVRCAAEAAVLVVLVSGVLEGGGDAATIQLLGFFSTRFT